MNDKLLEVTMAFRDKLSPGLDRASSKGKRSLGSLGTSVKSLITGFKALVAAAAALVIIRQVGRWLSFMVKEAASAQIAIAKLETTVEGNTDALLKQANALQAVTGIADDVITNAQSMLGTFNLNADAVARLTPGLLDMAASLQQASGGMVDLQAISIALGKAITGGAGALTRYGVTLSDAQAAQLDASAGMERVNIIANILEANFNGLAEAAGNTFTGAMNKLTLAWGDFNETLGNFIVESPGVNAAIKFITTELVNLTGAADDARESSDDLVGDAFVKLINGALQIAKGIIGLVNTFNVWRASIKETIISIIELDIKMSEATNVFGIWDGVIRMDKANIEILRAEIDAITDTIGRGENAINSITIAMETLDTIVGNTTGTISRGSGPITGMTSELDELAEAADGVASSLNSVVESMDKVIVSMSSMQSNAAATTVALPGIKKIPSFGLSGGKAGDRDRAARRQAKLDLIAGGGGAGFGEQQAAQAISTIGSGGGIGGLLPIIGSAFGPIGGAIGGLLGGLFGGNKKPRGNDPSKPVFVSDISLANTLTDLLNITKTQLARAGAGGINSINSQIRAQAGTTGAN